MEVKLSNGYQPAHLLDLSQHGLRFSTNLRVGKKTSVTCKISIPDSMSEEVVLKIKIRHNEKTREGYIIGGKIIEVENSLWLEIFKDVYKFITERAGEIY